MTFTRSLDFKAFLEDPRRVAARVAVQRQLESLKAALALANQNLGHLSVGFVRPACEEYLWLKYLGRLDMGIARELLMCLGNSDGMRGVQAMRDYRGEPEAAAIGFPPPFLRGLEHQIERMRDQLKDIGNKLGWPGPTPNTKWIADQVGERSLYDYLYSASSRSIHFSAGEIFRRAWFDASGSLWIRDGRHRTYLSDFAFDTLVVLALRTAGVAHRLDGEAEEGSGEAHEVPDVIKRFAALGRVAVVIPAEFNLAPGQDGRFAPQHGDDMTPHGHNEG